MTEGIGMALMPELTKAYNNMYDVLEREHTQAELGTAAIALCNAVGSMFETIDASAEQTLQQRRKT